METRLGQLLVDGGVLSQDQVSAVLEAQADSGLPFGVIAEERFGVDPASVETAWARQYALLTRTVDPRHEAFDPRAMELVTRRQAWQFRVLPIRFDENELMVATTQAHLRRALRFATHVIGLPVYFVMSDATRLGEALCRQYPMPGMTPGSVSDDGLDRLLAALA